MKRFLLYLKGLLLIVVFPAGCIAEVKEPAVAGSFYPGDKKRLAEEVDRDIAMGKPDEGEGRLLAIVSPHAGYVYSGPVAGQAYARIKGKKIKTVILLGPSHYADLKGAAIYPGTGMKTPLGTVRVDSELARSLASDKDGVTLSKEPFSREHSLEVQLPFLQRSLEDFSVVPILIGRTTEDSYYHLSDKIAAYLKKDEASILVISTDLSHYHDGKRARVMDLKVLDAAERLAGGELERLFLSGEGEMCGSGAVLYGIAAVRGAGATEGLLFSHADSSAASGDTSRVVGYGALGFYRKNLSSSSRREILALARETVDCQVNGRPLPEWKGSDRRMRGDGAVFVTLKEKDGRLRGCIGTLHAQMPLYRSIIQNGVAAATKDPRFRPVRPGELPDLDIEVTVISPMEPISSTREIEIGTHGIYLVAGGRSSVFLPQVPVEQGWNLDTYLAELAMKAGLPADGWKNGKLYRFTAEIVS